MAEKKSDAAQTDEAPGAIPKESLESGADASNFVDAPNKVDESQILQEEVLPGQEATPKDK